MKTVKCSSCSFVNTNATGTSVCMNCSELLDPAIFQQSMDELKKLANQLQQPKNPIRSFYSFNGFGTTLRDYRALLAGTYQAARWIIALFLPAFAPATHITEPMKQEFGYGPQTSRFNILGQTTLSVAGVARTYRLTIIGLAPIITGFIYSREIDRAFRGVDAFLLMIMCFAWAAYIILFKLKNEGEAFRTQATSEETA